MVERLLAFVEGIVCPDATVVSIGRLRRVSLRSGFFGLIEVWCDVVREESD